MFRCRLCHQIAYPSQREDVVARAHRRSRKLHERLGCPRGGRGLPPKPPRMWTRTWAQILDEISHYEWKVITHMQPNLDRVEADVAQLLSTEKPT